MPKPGTSILFAMVVVLPAGPSLAAADTGRVFPFGQPTGMGIVATRLHDAKGHFQLYGGTRNGQPADWNIDQWHIDRDLPPFERKAGTDDWVSKTAMAAVSWHPARAGVPQAIAFLQDGATLPCASGENDLGTQPNDWSDAAEPGRYPQATVATPTLDRLATFTMAGTYTLKQMRAAGGHKRCEVNQGGSSVTVQARTTSSPAQFFFYTIHLSLTCTDGGQPTARYRECRHGVEHPAPLWYWSGDNPPAKSCDPSGACSWGLDEPITSYTRTGYIADHATHALSFDVLPRMKQLIAAGTYGMDRDLSHWVMCGAGFGQAIWGDVRLGTSFEGFVPFLKELPAHPR